MANFLILFVMFYRHTIGHVLPPACRYSPTCSQFMIDAIKKNGAPRGLIQGLKRIGRCHPWAKNNYWDPIP